jgi:integrase
MAYRRQQPGSRRVSKVGTQSILLELHALSNLYKRAVAENVVEVNPVSRLPEKPRVEREEKVWLEIGEAARLLAAAGALDAGLHPRAIPYLRPILATFLLTGGRAQEVFGLETRDIDREGGIVHFRPNDWRRLKQNHHCRLVPLWPQLDQILQDYLERYERTTGLLFPASSGGMITDLRGSLGRALAEAEIEKRITWHSFRHTYTAARLQTTDHGAPVSPYTVMRELGHRSFTLIEKTYGHLMNVRHRSAVVEYVESEIVELVSQGVLRPA